jgi:hypothetical protein
MALFAVIADIVVSLRAQQQAVKSVRAAPAVTIDIQKRNNDLFVKSWFLITFMLIYLPVDFQIHMLNGWQAPIAILATHTLFDYVTPFVQRLLAKKGPPHLVSSSASESPVNLLTIRRALVVLLIMLILPTNLYLWTWRFIDLKRHDYPYYLHNDELAAFKWLEANAKPDDVVLSSLETGQYLPMFTGAHAYLAHWAQTLDFFSKQKAVERFFSINATDAQRQAILQSHDVDYVLIGPAERALGSYTLDHAAFATLAFSTPEVKVYEIKNGL